MQSVLEIESKANEFSKVKMKLEETIKHLTEKNEKFSIELLKSSN